MTLKPKMNMLSTRGEGVKEDTDASANSENEAGEEKGKRANEKKKEKQSRRTAYRSVA